MVTERRNGRAPVLCVVSALPFLVAAGAAACAAPTDEPGPVFYRPHVRGSESQFDPLRMSLQYVLDGAQIEGAGTSDYTDKVKLVWDHVREPIATIERGDGGWREFVNSELVPSDPDELDESAAILPNVFLHTFGGGMLYRKTGEWLEAHDVPLPWLSAGAIAMATELLGEASEKPATDSTDEVADVLVFRPIGLWLFHDVVRARRLRDTLGIVDWPYLLTWDADDGEFANTGMNYAFRPTWFESEDTSLFAHAGITNLFGLSHRLGRGAQRLSWGVGAATETVDPVELRASAGLFWDDDGGLLASLIGNGADGYAARLNVYPSALFDASVPLGLFAGVRDDGEITFGIHYVLPIGVGF